MLSEPTDADSMRASSDAVYYVVVVVVVDAAVAVVAADFAVDADAVGCGAAV